MKRYIKSSTLDVRDVFYYYLNKYYSSGMKPLGLRDTLELLQKYPAIKLYTSARPEHYALDLYQSNIERIPVSKYAGEKLVYNTGPSKYGLVLTQPQPDGYNEYEHLYQISN